MLFDLAAKILNIGMWCLFPGFLIGLYCLTHNSDPDEMYKNYREVPRYWYEDTKIYRQLNAKFKHLELFQFLFKFVFFFGFPMSCVFFFYFGFATTIPSIPDFPNYYDVSSINWTAFVFLFIPYNLMHFLFSGKSIVCTYLNRKQYQKDISVYRNRKREKEDALQKTIQSEQENHVKKQKQIEQEEAEIRKLQKEYYQKKLENLENEN